MTKKYVGTLIVDAWPQVQNDLPGFAVKQIDGHIGWLSQDTFEKTHQVLPNAEHLEPHQQQCVGEYLVLKLRRDKLEEFLNQSADMVIDTSTSAAEVNDLEEQLSVMNAYLEILARRLTRANILPT